MTLKERAKFLYSDFVHPDMETSMGAGTDMHEHNIEMLTAFARQVQAEAFKEAAQIANSHGLLWGENRNGVNASTVAQDEIRNAILARAKELELPALQLTNEKGKV